MQSKYKKIIFFLILVIFLTLLIFFLFLYSHISKNTDNSSILFKSSYDNHAWNPTSYGYYIYSNGVIKEFDEYDTEKKLKSAKINKIELTQLQKLANIVEDKYTPDPNGPQFWDSGTRTRQIYNSNLSKWIILYKDGDSMGENLTETSQEILTLTSKLYDKYLN